MTTGKRALIVDDSRSARVILSRMLEQHGMAVDTAESAEQALDYLRQQRPDVIFMDHLMPGMDGFQAVQAIKGDPQTATIPLMMYTSQEGELYVSQARALGAVGVLPKTVRPADVSRVLYQLHLLQDRRQERSPLFDAAGAAARAAAGDVGPAASEGTAPAEESATGTHAALVLPAATLSELQGSLRQSLQQVVKDQLAEQRRFTLATFEAFARRMSGEIKEGMAKAPPPPAAEPMPPEPPPTPWWPVALTALLAAVPAAILGYLYWQATERTLGLSRELAESRAASVAAAAAAAAAAAVPVARETLAAPARPLTAETAGPATPAGPTAVEFVPYGEAPLAGARLERLRGLAATLEAEGFQGRILVETFTGDYCLSGSVGEGFEPAEATLPTKNCDLVGNPFDDAQSPAQRQSVDFANFVATLDRRTAGAIIVETASAGRRSPVLYADQGESSTAGDWNAVAAQNNRVEFRAVPAAVPAG
jgi:CheY-like chemotaxis protein